MRTVLALAATLWSLPAQAQGQQPLEEQLADSCRPITKDTEWLCPVVLPNERVRERMANDPNYIPFPRERRLLMPSTI